MSLTTYTVEELKDLLRAGGSVDLSAAHFSADEWTNVVRSAAGNEFARIVLRNVSSFDLEELKSIARAGKGRVTFAD